MKEIMEFLMGTLVIVVLCIGILGAIYGSYLILLGIKKEIKELKNGK